MKGKTAWNLVQKSLKLCSLYSIKTVSHLKARLALGAQRRAQPARTKHMRGAQRIRVHTGRMRVSRQNWVLPRDFITALLQRGTWRSCPPTGLQWSFCVIFNDIEQISLYILSSGSFENWIVRLLDQTCSQAGNSFRQLNAVKKGHRSLSAQRECGG